MEDNRKFDNDGTEINSSIKGDDFPHHEPITESEPPLRKRFNWSKLALVLILVGLGLYGIGHLADYSGGGIIFDGGRFQIHEASYEANFIGFSQDIDYVTINTTSIRVIIEPASQGESGGVHLINVEPSVLNISDGRINIDTRPIERRTQFHLFNFNQMRREILIQLPVDAELLDVEVRSTSGSVRIGGVNADLIAATSTSGSVRLNDSQALSIRAVSTSGSVHMNNLQAPSLYARSTSGSVRGESLDILEGELRSTSGSINVSDIIWLNLQANSTSGAVRITNGEVRTNMASTTALQSTSGSANLEIRGNRDDFSYTISTTSGTARINGESHGRGTITDGRGEHTISIRTVSGSSRLNFIN